MSAFLLVGLAVIVGLALVEHFEERPHFDWSRIFRHPTLFVESDLQVEGMARSGDVREAIAMYQRLHKADYKKAQRAVMLLASGEREQAAAMDKASPGLIPRSAMPSGNRKLGQLASALVALQAAKGRRGRGRR